MTSTQSDSKIIVIGGGIGGLCVAIALRQRGFSPVIYEQTTVLKPAGAGIVLAFNAMRVLKKLGIYESVCNAGFGLKSVTFETEAGQRLLHQDFAAFESELGASVVGIHRHALHQCLLDQLPADSIHLGRRCHSFERHGDISRVNFEDGTFDEAKLVIVADGLRSVLRAQLFPQDRLRYSGESGWRGTSLLTLPTHQPFREIWGRHFRFGAFQCAPNRVSWYATVNAPAGTLVQDHASAKSVIASHAQSLDHLAQQIIASTEPGSIIQTDLFDKAPSRPWFQDGIVFLGDAIHATTPNFGQGAGMAIESAYVLAEHFATEGIRVETLKHYQNRRYPRTTWVTSESLKFGKMARLQHPVLIAIRNALIRMMAHPILTKFQRKNMLRLWRGID